MIKVLVALAAVVAGVLVWRRRRAEGSTESEVYESGGMVRVGPVPDAPAADPTPQA